MKKSILLSTFLSASFLILYSEIGSPPVDSAGAPPSNASCTKSGCHSGSTVTDASKFTLRLAVIESELANFASIVNDSTTFVPGQTYFAALQLSSGAAVYGFQLVALDAANAQAGAFTVTDNIHTKINNAGSRAYIGHKNANTTKDFNFKWTAPNTATPVTFYCASVFGNGNNQNSGDNIYKSTSTIQPLEGTGIENLSSIENFNVYPTQTISRVAVKLNAAVTQSAQITLVDMSGKVVKTLYDGKLSAGENEFLFDVSELPQGNYLLSLQGDRTHLAKHITRL